MINQIAQCEDRQIKIVGPVSSGKTETLIRRCVTLIENGADPASILVICCASFACAAFSDRLAAALGEANAEKAKQVTVQTALEACLSTLARPEVEAITGRKARLILPFEYNFMLEDMKTTGMARREIRKMLNVFYRNWADGADESEWCRGDGKTVCDRLLFIARALGGVIKEEVPYLTAQVLRGPKGPELRGAYDYVFCDDYQNLSHAEQICVSLHASRQLIVAGNTNQQSRTESSFANPDGFAKYETLRRGVTTFTLTKAFGNAHNQRLANALTSSSAMDETITATMYEDDGEAVTSVKWLTPKDELVGLTKMLRDEFNRHDDLFERDVCIVVPNKRWGRMYERALGQRGFKVSSAGVVSGIGGDPRNLATCPALVAYVKLNLIAHPDDAMAWRLWTGLGDYLTNSQSWEPLYDRAEKTGISVIACLEELTQSLQDHKKEPYPRAYTLAERYVSGKQLIENHEARRGFNLFSAIGMEDLPEFTDVEESLVGDEDVQALYDLVRKHVISPVFPDNNHILRMSIYANMPGTSYKTIIAPALVDGYMPNRNAFEVVSTDRERKAVMDTERHILYGMLGKAHDRLILSHFSKADLELAERTKMQVGRIRSEEGQRIALARPCCYFNEFGASAPGTISGQSYLAERNLN